MPRLATFLTALALSAALALPTTAPALAGPAENAVLKKYEGSWKGTGKVTGPDAGTVVCRITLKAAATGKVNYSGRCSFGAGAASFRGTMLYNDAKKRYEASSSAQGVSATAIGKKQGGGVVFAMSGMENRYGTASSTLSLTGGAIKMSFKLVDTDGETTASSITFGRS